jgi:hypothetical protein
MRVMFDMGKKENYTTKRRYEDPNWFTLLFTGKDPGKFSGGVEMSVPQVQAIREFVGLPLPWIRQFGWTKEKFEDNLAPFFNGKPQLDKKNYKNIAAHISDFPYWNPDLVSEREDIQKAIIKCIKATAFYITVGEIKFDAKEIFKLKAHPAFTPCKELLYQHLMLGKDQLLQKVNDDDVKNEIYNIDIFLKAFQKNIQDDITINWKILKKDQSNKKILENITKLIKPPDSRLLDGKVTQLKSGKFKFNAVEDQYLEYKQSMFSPDISEIKQVKKNGYPDKYKKLLKGKQNSLINDVLSTVCAFLNTNDGELYIGVLDKPRQIIGLSDDRNSGVFNLEKHPSYTEFQELYKKKILQLMKNKITNFEMSYVERIHYLPNYGEDDNGDNIDVLCIPCQKTPSDKPPVRLKNELNEEGEKIKEEEILYERVDESDVPVPKIDEPRFLMDKQRRWAEVEYKLGTYEDKGRTYSTNN